MDPLKDQLKKILFRDQFVSPEDFELALAEYTRAPVTLGKTLLRLKLISEDTLTYVLSEIAGFPPINLSRLSIDLKIVKLIPKEFAQKHHVIPIALLGNHLSLAMADPFNIFVIDNVKMLTGCFVSPLIASAIDIEKALEKSYQEETPVVHKKTETFDEIIQDIRQVDDLELVKDTQRDGPSMVEQLTDEAPIIKLTDTIIQQAVLSKASDVFIEPLENELRVRYRIDGIIREIDRMPKVLHPPIISRIKVIANLDIAEHRLPQDGRFKTIISGDHEVSFRVSVLLTISGEKIVLRVLDQEGTVLDVDKLGFEPASLMRLKECAAKPHGMILACGPTGSGKTTTLYSILKYIDSPEKNIVTVEDPVEYQIRGINQVNIKPALDLTFPVCLRSILRQDPDIIMIGEIRDAETLDIAVKAALTGHLVLSSLHTTTAAGSIVRMINMGVEPFLICSSILAIVA